MQVFGPLGPLPARHPLRLRRLTFGSNLQQVNSFAALEIGAALESLLGTVTMPEHPHYPEDPDGVLRGSSYLGSGNRFETGNIRITPDGGLVVVGRALVAGRFPRLSLFKLSA